MQRFKAFDLLSIQHGKFKGIVTLKSDEIKVLMPVRLSFLFFSNYRVPLAKVLAVDFGRLVGVFGCSLCVA